MVLIKIGVLLMFIVIGITGWNSNNLADFAPFGLSGITTAAGIIFFSYIGLDAVSTAGEEVKNPHQTMPLAIIIALVTVTTLYIVVAIVAVAAQPYTQFDGQEAGLAQILENITGSTWPGTVLAAGAVVSIFSVTLVVIYGQTRILFAMARDGMIPELFHKVNPRTRTPVANTIIVATIIAILAGFIPINFLAEMTSVGTLVAFSVVSIAVIILRVRQPELPRGFKVPGYPVTPVLAVLGCLWIIKDLRLVTLVVFVVWTAIVLVWYFTYGLKHSHLGRHEHVGLLDDPSRTARRDPGKGPNPMHEVDQTTEQMVRSVLAYAENRLRMDPVPLDKGTQSAADLYHVLDGVIRDRGRSPDEVLGVYSSVIAPSIISADSPRFLGFIPAAPTKASLLFDMLVSCASIQGISWLEASGAIAAENTVLRLIADEAGMPAGAGGCFVSGGSAGNLSAHRGGQGDRQEAAGRGRRRVGDCGSSSAPTRTPRSSTRCGCWRWTPWWWTPPTTD